MVSPAAHFTAQAWVREGFPNSKHFDTFAGRTLFGPVHSLLERLGPKAPSLPWHEQFLLIRHYAYEERIRRLGPDFVLEIGAGLSPRGLTLASDNPQLSYVEVDLPKVIETKKRLLKGVALPSNYHLLAGDLLTSRLAESLTLPPRPAHNVLIVTEGVIDYLAPKEKAEAWSNISDFLRSRGGGRYLFEVYTRTRLAKYPLSSGAALVILSLATGRRFDKRLFRDSQEAVRAIKRCGFSTVEVLDVGALNTSPYQPPMDFCHFELIEARV